MDYLISMYIDNELSFDDKIIFVEQVHSDQHFKDDAVSFLRQEKILRSALPQQAPEMTLPFLQRINFPFLTPKTLGLVLAASLFILVAFYFSKSHSPQIDFHPAPVTSQHRFVLYQSGTKQVEIAGSFTNWKRIPLKPAGTSGYWEISLEVPPGEHAFSYILDGDEVLPDPTIPVTEKDDFGTVNSILVMEKS